MNTRFLLVGTIVCAVALFVWQSVSNAALPWHRATMSEFQNDSATVQAIRAAAPANGVYTSMRGVVAAVAIRPDFGSREVEMPAMLGRQFALDLVVSLVLCFVVMRLPAASATATGVTLGLAALAVSGIQSFSDWIWYGFTFPYAAVNAIDLAINGLVAGLVLGALLARERARGEPGVRAPAGVGVSAGDMARK
ncbi:MAG TPA: hypothetical protein VFZ11_06845 [Gemmatimonadaceae bacterium]